MRKRWMENASGYVSRFRRVRGEVGMRKRRSVRIFMGIHVIDGQTIFCFFFLIDMM